jgi:hypothetical protein
MIVNSRPLNFCSGVSNDAFDINFSSMLNEPPEYNGELETYVAHYGQVADFNDGF